MRDRFLATLTEAAAYDDRIMLVTGDLGFAVIDRFAQAYPNRFLNVGVAEQNMIGVSTGLALLGFVPFTYSIANFSFMRCLEQIRNDAAYHQANVKVVSVGAGFSYGALGVSHHATEDIAIMRSLPGVAVFSPCDFWETEHVVKAMLSWPGVAYVRLDKSVAKTCHHDDEIFQVGKPRKLLDGKDLCLIATGGIVDECLKAAHRLRSFFNIQCSVISLHTIKPLDANALLNHIKNVRGIITVEEHNIVGGLGSAVAEIMCDFGVRVDFFARLGLRDCFSSVVGSQTYLRRIFEIDEEAIVRVARAAFSHQKVEYSESTYVE